jgi:hypothetical protein
VKDFFIRDRSFGCFFNESLSISDLAQRVATPSLPRIAEEPLQGAPNGMQDTAARLRIHQLKNLHDHILSTSTPKNKTSQQKKHDFPKKIEVFYGIRAHFPGGQSTASPWRLSGKKILHPPLP